MGLFIAELCPFFVFCIVNLWNLLNKISGELLELDHDVWHKVLIWHNSVNILLNYLPFLTLALCIVKQPYVWVGVLLFIPYLWISKIHFWIFLVIHNSFLDIQKSIYGYPKIHFWISKNQLNIGYP